MCIALWPLLQSTLFLHYSCFPGRVGHTANLIKFATTICEIWVFKVLLLFLSFYSSYAIWGATGTSIYFCTLCKNCYKMQTCNLVASIISTNKEHVMVDSHTKFAVNLKNIQGVMSIYSRKNRSKFCHGYSVNRV